MNKFKVSSVLISLFLGISGSLEAQNKSIAKDQSPIKEASVKSSLIGLEVGGNGSLLVSDPTVQAFGAGAGYQGSLFYSFWNEKKIGAKVRAEMASLQEVAIQKSQSEYLAPGTSLKSLTQGWTLISAGAEGHFDSHKQTFFWEALLGYAMGATNCNVTVTYSTPDIPHTSTTQSCNSGFAISGGVGIKKNLAANLVGVMSVRTLFLIGPVYSAAPLSTRTLIPLPLLFSLGAGYPF